MSGKENIIANILADARAEKDRILAAAKEKADEIARADEAFCKEAEQNVQKRAEENERLTVARYVSVANMDVKKVLLQAKQDKISKTFERAEEKILSMDKEAYAAFILSLLDKYAEEGDEVVLSARDKERITPAEIAAYATKKGIALTCRADGAFSGGIVLEGKVYDKNLTLSMLLKEYKEAHETEIIRILSE